MLYHLQGEKFNKSKNTSTNGLVAAMIRLQTDPSPNPSLKKKHNFLLKSAFTTKITQTTAVDTTKQKTIQYNIMDFGGQEIFHSTHRFFLTASAVYIVMFNLNDLHTHNRVEYPFVTDFKLTMQKFFHVTYILAPTNTSNFGRKKQTYYTCRNTCR